MLISKSKNKSTNLKTKSTGKSESNDSSKQLNGYSKHRPSYFTPKIKFTLQEDMLLYNAVRNHGTDDWHVIASKVPGRNPRQCRERWNNYVNPSLISTPWTAEEDYLLMKKYQELGSHWCAIASYFSSRSTNSVKNRFIILNRRQNKEMKKDNKKIKKDTVSSSPLPNKQKLLRKSSNSTALQKASAILNIDTKNNFQLEREDSKSKIADPFEMFDNLSIDWFDVI